MKRDVRFRQHHARHVLCNPLFLASCADDCAYFVARCFAYLTGLTQPKGNQRRQELLRSVQKTRT